MGRVCRKCKKRIPSGYNIKYKEDYDIVNEVKRNEKRKEQFQVTKTLGKLEFDTENHLFHIDNSYYSVLDVSAFSFYTGEPRYKYGLFGRFDMRADIYFTFTPIEQERRIRCVKRAEHCKYYNNGEIVSVEPPANMQIMNETFRQMIDDEYYVITRQLFSSGEEQ